MAKQNNKEILGKILADFIAEDDPLLSMLQWMTDQMMLIEAEKKVGAEKGEHNKERQTYFSGKRARRFDTRMGTMYLLVPKVRKGGYVPFFVTEKKRSEQALISMIQEAFVNGVSTRKVERLAKKLGIENISAGQVSEINKGLNEQVDAFRTRPLDSEYPFIWIDAVYEKIRDNGRVCNHAIMVAYGVNMQGHREILAVEPMWDESTATWGLFFDKLKNRGVKNIELCISDAHKGIQEALKEKLIGTSWQRCKVHFMRNIMAHVPHRDKAKFGERLKQIWLQADKEDALKVAQTLVSEYEDRYTAAIDCLLEGLEDSLQFYSYPAVDKRRIASTNVLERINREIRRRSRVVGIFPSQESYIRLLTSYLIEYSEDWATGNRYLSKKALEIIAIRKEDRQQSAA